MMKATFMFGLLFGAGTCLSNTATTAPSDLDPHARDFMRFRTACQESGFPSPAMLIGKASSMEKIMPRGEFSAQPMTKDGLAVRLAGNEYESVQLLVSAKGVEPVRIPFSVRVNGFTLGRTSALPLAITFSPEPNVQLEPPEGLAAAAGEAAISAR